MQSSSGAVATAAGPRRRPVSSVYGRISVANGVVFTVAALVLALSPATVSTPISPRELGVLGGGLAVMLVVNAVLIRRILRPLSGLGALMARVDLLDPGARVDERGSSDLVALLHSFNVMLDRLETERNEASAQRVADQEEERGRIARELHDGTGQSLTAVLLGLRRMVDRAPDELRDDLADLQEVTRDALDEVREVATQLRPRVLGDLGLASALADLAEEFARRTGMGIEHDLDRAVPGLDPATELAFYRIAQESLTNAARHTDDGVAQVSLTAEHGRVVLRVRDSGCGCEPGRDQRQGLGLRGMQERAVLVGADLTITTGAIGGTDIALSVPLPGAVS